MEIDNRLVEQPLLDSAPKFAEEEAVNDAAQPIVQTALEIHNPDQSAANAPNHSTDSAEVEIRESTVSSSLTNSNSNSNSTSISSITVSPPSQINVDEFPVSYSPSRGHKKSPTSAQKGKTSPHKASEGDKAIEKKLSFRTDSTGSMGSLVSGLDLSVSSTIPEEHSDEDEDSPAKSKFNQNNMSSASILVSALKQKKKPLRKKSVSFSLPSADDISRKAKKAAQPLLYSMLNDFDDNIADYQITSPKSAYTDKQATKPRAFSSPTRSGKYSSAIEIQDLGDTVGIATHSPTGVGRELFSSSPDLPPRPSHSRESSGEARHSSPSAERAEGSSSRHDLRSLAISNNHAQNHAHSHQQKHPLPHMQVTHHTHKHPHHNHANGGNTGDGATVGDDSATPPLPSLIQRICEAKTSKDLCQVFGIASESVFTGEKMNKKFSKDLTAKGRVVWIVPQTKSIHWAKNSKERGDSSKVKYFLLDKNSPHVNAPAGSVVLQANTNTNTSTSSSVSATTLDLPASPSPVPTSSSAAEESATEQKGSESGGDALKSGASSSETTPADTTATNGANCTSANSYSVGRAQGELLGIIHSAVISHLTIKIHTESGEYLALTVKSGPGAVQTAKDWFSVIKTLTKDV